MIIPMLLLGDLIFGKYSRLFFHREFSYYIFRNFLFVGIPYFLIGVMMKKKEGALVQIREHKKILLFLIILFCLTTMLERWILVISDLNSSRDHYISTPLLSIVLFIVFSDCSWNAGKLRFAKLIGRKHSMMIYIIHPMIIDMIDAAVIKIGRFDLYDYIKPGIVFILSLLFSMGYYHLSELFIIRRKNEKKTQQKA